MDPVTIDQAVAKLAALSDGMSDADLERPWTWKDYGEGVRFAFFRIYETLATLSVQLEQERKEHGRPITSAQRILGQYLDAYRALQAILPALTEKAASRPPAEGEWPLRTILAHIIQAERSFFAILVYTIDGARQKDGRPEEMTEEAWNEFWQGDPFRSIVDEGSFSELSAYFAGLHTRVLQYFTGLADRELELLSTYWESERMTVEFRLHRFHSHLRQHTIQVEKTLERLGDPPTEIRRLLRLVFAALAAAEGAALGAGEIGQDLLTQAAEDIEGYIGEIALAIVSHS